MSKNVSRTRSPARSSGSTSPRRLRSRPSSSNSDSLALSPGGRRSLLNDNTEIDVPRRKSWWKKIGKNSIDIKEVFGDYVAENENFDIENIVQPNAGPSNRQMMKPAIDLGNMSDSSTSESLGSIHMPQRKLFVNRQTQQPNEFLNIVARRESLRRNKNETEKTIHVPKKDLFRKGKAKENKDNAFPVSIISVNAANNTTKKDDGTINIDTDGLKKPLFGKRQANKPAPFPVFVMSESEDDTPQVHPRLTAFKKNPQMLTRSRRTSAGSRSSKRAHSPASSVYSETMELETWKLLPSSTMIGDDLVMNTPAKRLRRDKTIREVDDEMDNNEADYAEMGKMMVDEVERNNFAEDIQNRPDNIGKENKAQPEDDPQEIESVRPQNEEEENDKADDQDFIHEDIPIAQESDNVERNDDSIEQLKNKANAENVAELNNDEEPEAAIDAPSDCGDQADNQDKESQKEIAQDTQGEDNDNNDEDSELNQDDVENLTEEQNEHAMEDEVESILKSDYEESDNDDICNKEKNDANENAIENAGGLDDIQEVENEEASDNENSVVQNKSKKVENAEAFNDDDMENNQSQDGVQNIAKADDEDGDEQDDNNAGDEEMGKMEISAESDNETNINDNDNENIDHDVTTEYNNDREEIEVENPSENEENEAEDPTVNEENEVEDPSENEEHEVEEPSENEENEAEDSALNDEVEDPSENEENEAEDSALNYEVENPSENEENEAEDSALNDEVEDPSENEENEAEDSALNYEVENPSENEKNEAEDSTRNDENDAKNPTLNEENEVDDPTLEDNEAEDSSDNEENKADCPTVNEESELEDPPNEKNEEEDINQNRDTSDGNNHTDHFHAKSLSGKSSNDERTLNKSKNQSRRISPRSANVSIGGIDPARMSHVDNSNRQSAEFSKNMTDEVRYSSEGSGWNSHTTAYFQRAEQTMNARKSMKSMRTLLLDKTAKIRPSTKSTEKNDDHNFTKPASPARFSVTNNTIENNISVYTPNTNKTSSSKRTQTSMDGYIKKITQDNWERQQKIQEKVQNSLKANSSNFEAKYFQWSQPNQRKLHQKDQNKPKPKTKQKETLNVVIDGAVYKPPKLFKPPKAPWVNKNLYKFLDVKLKPKHRYNARIQSERFVRLLFEIYKHCVKRSTDVRVSIKSLKKKMALLDLVTTHFDFYNFVEEYMPKDFRIRVIPDHLNCLPMPRNGLFGNIIDPNVP